MPWREAEDLYGADSPFFSLGQMHGLTLKGGKDIGVLKWPIHGVVDSFRAGCLLSQAL